MDRTERFYRIEQTLRNQKSVRLDDFIRDMGISQATFKRDIEYMRDRLNVPILWDRETRGYFLSQETKKRTSPLPGLWFAADEIRALLTMKQVLEDMEPGILSRHVQPLFDRLCGLLEQGDDRIELQDRIRVFHVTRRRFELRHFEISCNCVLQRKQIKIVHYNRDRDTTLERIISPQKLTFYRENWYVDAWCHLRESIRCFSIDSIESAFTLNEKAIDINEDTMREHFSKGYGIFSGQKLQWATLKFEPKRAKWVRNEIWHPEQRQSNEPDGSLLLEVPYSDDREILMDILRHGTAVEVLNPPNLRKRTIDAIRDMSHMYV